MQMFARKYQRIAADYASKGAVFLEILGDETAETRVSLCAASRTPAAHPSSWHLEGLHGARACFTELHHDCGSLLQLPLCLQVLLIHG